MASVACPTCSYPNDKNFRFCQQCGYARRVQQHDHAQTLKAPVDLVEIHRRKQDLELRALSTPYAKQKTALEKEFMTFLLQTSPGRDLTTATPDDVITFLIWKDNFGKTVVHRNHCEHLGNKRAHLCGCPKRLAFGTVDSVVGKLRAIFNQWGRTLEDTRLPGYGNPAASHDVHSYVKMVREEQLSAQIVPTQAEPFFIRDLVAISELILKRLQQQLSPIQLYIASRDHAFFKGQFFAGDRAGDFCTVKTREVLYLPRKEGLLFNHTLTKSLRNGTTNLFALKRHANVRVCPVAAIEMYIKMCDLLHIPIREGFLFRSTSQSGEVRPSHFESSAVQARLNCYVADLPSIFDQRRVTLHGLRNGCAISLALAGVDRAVIMEHVGWRTTATANHYMKLHQVMTPGGASDILAHLALDWGELYRQRNDMSEFTQAF